MNGGKFRSGMKKILILSANAIPNCGGQGLNLHHMVQGLSESFEISLFCRQACAAVKTEVVPPSRSDLIGRIPVVRRLRDWQNLWSDRHFDHYVARRMKSAHLFQGAGGQCYESLGAARSLGCRTAVDCVTTHIDDFESYQRIECARFQVRPATNERSRHLQVEEYRRADLIRVLSEHAKRTFLERGFQSERVIVARPPINVDEFPAAEFKEPKFRVSFVGLLEPWKGFHYLIQAFQSLGLADSELTLWGGPGTRSVNHYLQEQLASNPAIKMRPVSVRELGYGEVYGKSSVLVHPSLSEGFGYVVAEAMASGIPVIVTRNTGSADLVVDGKNGYVVPVRDPEAIRDRLAHLASHPAVLREMGRAARETMRAVNGDGLRRYYAGALEKLAS
jgi:glycosyltransferase involved in cell wall biosynthesis